MANTYIYIYTFPESTCFTCLAFTSSRYTSGRQHLLNLVLEWLLMCFVFLFCFFLNEQLTSECTSMGGGVIPIHSRSLFQFLFQLMFLPGAHSKCWAFQSRLRFCLLRLFCWEMPFSDTKEEGNKAGDLINELPLDVGMCKQIRHERETLVLRELLEVWGYLHVLRSLEWHLNWSS